jgi:hypothetical protein
LAAKTLRKSRRARLLFGIDVNYFVMMLVFLGWLVIVSSHEFHHQKVREGAQQHEPSINYPADWNLKQGNCSKGCNRDQAAGDHDEHMFLGHDFLLFMLRVFSAGVL